MIDVTPVNDRRMRKTTYNHTHYDENLRAIQLPTSIHKRRASDKSPRNQGGTTSRQASVTCVSTGFGIAQKLRHTCRSQDATGNEISDRIELWFGHCGKFSFGCCRLGIICALSGAVNSAVVVSIATCHVDSRILSVVFKDSLIACGWTLSKVESCWGLTYVQCYSLIR